MVRSLLIPSGVFIETRIKVDNRLPVDRTGSGPRWADLCVVSITPICASLRGMAISC
jgi:hypothetical protein